MTRRDFGTTRRLPSGRCGRQGTGQETSSRGRSPVPDTREIRRRRTVQHFWPARTTTPGRVLSRWPQIGPRAIRRPGPRHWKLDKGGLHAEGPTSTSTRSGGWWSVATQPPGPWTSRSGDCVGPGPAGPRSRRSSVSAVKARDRSTGHETSSTPDRIDDADLSGPGGGPTSRPRGASDIGGDLRGFGLEGRWSGCRTEEGRQAGVSGMGSRRIAHASGPPLPRVASSSTANPSCS